MIPMFAPVYHVDDCMEEIRVCLEKGWTGQGFKTLEFEEKWKAYTGFAHAHLVCTATAGLNLAVEILKEQNGWSDYDEIISTPITFVATNNAVLTNKMKVVFADIDRTLCLDPEDVEKKISPKTKAVIFVGLGGNTGHYDKIVRICRRNGLKIILDAAHMAGTRVNGEIPGKDADVVVYSFHVTKNLTTADSGMVCFADKAGDEAVRKRSWNGIDNTTSPARYARHYKWKQNITHAADAYNGNSIMAAIAIAQLPYLDEENRYRRQVAGWYQEELADARGIEQVEVPKECESSRWLYQILVQDRDGMMEFLQGRGIGCALHYLDNTEYPMYEGQNGICRFASYASDHLVSLPCHLKISREDVHTVANSIKEFMQQCGSV